MPDTEVIEPVVEEEAPPEDLVEDELLVEDVSIDGMCGVY
jgi:mycofactocin precursor